MTLCTWESSHMTPAVRSLIASRNIFIQLFKEKWNWIYNKMNTDFLPVLSRGTGTHINKNKLLSGGWFVE